MHKWQGAKPTEDSKTSNFALGLLFEISFQNLQLNHFLKNIQQDRKRSEILLHSVFRIKIRIKRGCAKKKDLCIKKFTLTC